jgi:hypothetical protein
MLLSMEVLRIVPMEPDGAKQKKRDKEVSLELNYPSQKRRGL